MPIYIHNIITHKFFHLFVATSVAILTTGFLRLAFFTAGPSADSGFYSFVSQYIYYALNNGENLKSMMLHLYQMMTFWVYAFDVNQYIVLRLIDGLVAVIASIIFFKVILKESDSILFTIILMIPLLVTLNSVEVSLVFGYENSIWAAYLPLFTALLIWQKSSKEDTFSFYIIGALVSFGVLLREPFLPFFLLAAVAIFTSYGWRVLLKYLIGSAILGFSVLAVLLSFRGWDLLDLIDSYMQSMNYFDETWDTAIWTTFKLRSLLAIKTSWFLCITALVSITYIIKLHATDKDSVSMTRFFFWLLVALIPILESMLKFSLAYHFFNCLPGLAGLSAMGWKYINNNVTKQLAKSSMMVISIMSLIVIVPSVNRYFIKSDYIYSLSDAVDWSTVTDPQIPWRGISEINQYLILSAKIYELSRDGSDDYSKRSTLAIAGGAYPLFPITKLLPPTFRLAHLENEYSRFNYNENKFIKVLEKYRPTFIVVIDNSIIKKTLSSNFTSKSKDSDIPNIIKKSNLYDKVSIIPANPIINHGWKSGIIYRLKKGK